MLSIKKIEKKKKLKTGPVLTTCSELRYNIARLLPNTTQLRTGPFKNRTFLSGFQMYCHKMVAICPDFK